jgi:glycosyltransferase involved in cell wall biosynthesis
MVSKALVVGAYHAKLREMARLGIDVTAIIPRTWGRQRPETTDGGGYRIRLLACARSGRFAHFYPNILSVLRYCKADLIHLDEEPFTPVAFEFLAAARLRRTPALFFTWQNLLEDYPWYYDFFERYTFHHVRGAIAGNEEARGVLVKRGFRKPVWVIPQFGVDPDIFRKSDSSRLRHELDLEGKFVVGFSGRLVEEKGVDTLVAAFSRLPDDVALLIVGSGPFQVRLEQLCRELGVAERVRLVPFVDSREVPKYLNAFDVLVLPSRTRPNWKEQFGRVLIEAMACEVPVIGSDSGEIPRVIDESGYTFPEGDASALAAALEGIRYNAALRLKLGSAGRARVLGHFTQAEIARRTVEVYDRLIKINASTD